MPKCVIFSDIILVIQGHLQGQFQGQNRMFNKH